MARRAYIKVSYPDRNCVECGEPFKPIRRDQIFCARKIASNRRASPTTCKDRAGNRELTRAKALYRYMYWLVRKGVPKDEQGRSLSAINRQMRAWRDEDEANGIPAPPPPEEVQAAVASALFAERLTGMGLEDGEVRKRTGLLPGEAGDQLGMFRKLGLVRPKLSDAEGLAKGRVDREPEGV